MDPCTRQSLPGYSDALARVLAAGEPLEVVGQSYRDALGLTLAQDLFADRDQPPFHRSAMDGFAVHAVDIQTGAMLRITGTVAAGAEPHCYQTPVAEGCAYRIATGAPLPAGADTVIPVELSYIDEVDGSRVGFEVDQFPVGKNIHRQGVDARAGHCVLRAGTVLGPHHIAIAVATGHTLLPVHRSLRVTLLTTGDEVRPPETLLHELEPQQIRNSNGPLVVALLSLLGVKNVTHLHLPDEPEPTMEAAKESLQHSDMVLTVGGVSAGQRDHLPATWQKLDVTPILHGVAIQPGKPVFCAVKQGTMILGLPGNPVSVLATAHLFAWPLICRLLNRPLPQWQSVTLCDAYDAQPGRDRFRLVRLSASEASLITSQGSGDLMHTAPADGFVWLKHAQEPCESGQIVPFLPLLQ